MTFTYHPRADDAEKMSVHRALKSRLKVVCSVLLEQKWVSLCKWSRCLIVIERNTNKGGGHRQNIHTQAYSHDTSSVFRACSGGATHSVFRAEHVLFLRGRAKRDTARHSSTVCQARHSVPSATRQPIGTEFLARIPLISKDHSG